MLSQIMQRFVGTSHKFTATEKIVTVPNMVTATGLVGVVAYMQMLAVGPVWLIPAVFILVVMSDVADGWLADRFNQHTKLGQALDPMRDRLLTATVLMNILLLSPGAIPVAMILVTLLAELLIAVIAVVMLRHRKVKMAAHTVGKSRAAVQWLITWLFLVGVYWIEWDPTGYIWLVTTVVMVASLAAMSFYGWRACVHLRR